MKPFIIGLATFFLCLIGLVWHQDDILFQHQIHRLKWVAEEAAAAAAQYYDYEEYSQGRKIFNRVEGQKAAEYIIKDMLKLDEFFNPGPYSYWTDTISYEIFFYDDADLATGPIIYTDSDNFFTLAIGEPTVIVKINAGHGRYRTLPNPPIAIRTAAHEWQSY